MLALVDANVKAAAGDYAIDGTSSEEYEDAEELR